MVIGLTATTRKATAEAPATWNTSGIKEYFSRLVEQLLAVALIVTLNMKTSKHIRGT